MKERPRAWLLAVRGLVPVTPVGDLVLKGKAEPVPAFEVPVAGPGSA